MILGATSGQPLMSNPAGPGTTRATEMEFVVNHAPGAESITGAVDLQSRVLPLC